MANQFVDFTGGNPEMARIQRQLQMAEMLRQQSQEPIPIMSGGGAQAPISWASILSKGLQAYGANKKEQDAEDAIRKAQDEDRDSARALARKLSGMDNMHLAERPIAASTVDVAGVPVSMPGSDGPGGVAPTPPSPQQQLAMLLAAGDGPRTQAIAGAMLPRVFAEQDYTRGRKDKLEDRAAENQMNRDNTLWQNSLPMSTAAGQQIAAQGQQAQSNAQFQNNLPMTPYQQQQLAIQRQQVAATASGRNQPPTGYRWAADGTRMEVIPGGPADTTGMRGNATDTQRVTALYADRAKEANRILSDPKLESAISSVGQRAKASIPGVGNFLVSEEYQKADQAQRDFINAVLRKESGAVIGADEFENARLQYFPQPGDSAAVKEQKRANRETAINGLHRAAGTAINEGQTPAGAPQGGFSIRRLP